MIYILAEIFNYRQLVKINEHVCEQIKAGFEDAVSAKKCRLLLSTDGYFLFSLGPEQVADPKNACDSLFHLYGIIDHFQKDLHGFLMFTTILEEKDTEVIFLSVKEAFSTIDAEDGIWTTRNAKTYFDPYVRMEQSEYHHRIIAKKDQPEQKQVLKKTEWVRQKIFNRIMDAITPQLNTEQEPRIIFVSGPKGCGKTTVVLTVVEKLIGSEHFKDIPFLSSRSRKKSFHHPFTNSLSTGLLNNLKSNLNPLLAEVWKEHGWILSSIKSGSIVNKCPDHFHEDYFIEYAVYLSAFLELAKKNLFPGLFVCDDVDKYHTSTLAALYKLIRDHFRYHNFFPIVISSYPELPDELNKFPFVHIEIEPIDSSEIKQLSKMLFPGLELSRKAIKSIGETSRGQIPIINQLFTYLAATGVIKRTNSHFIFVVPKEGTVPALPGPAALVFWYITKVCDQNERDILYLIYLTSGLLDARHLTDFLALAGFESKVIEESLERLIRTGIVTRNEYVSPVYPGMKNRLMQIMGERGAYLRDTFVAFAETEYRAGRLRKYVLLFSCFFNNGKIDSAIELLAILVRKKLDEINTGGVKPFLSFKNVKLPDSANENQKVLLKLIIYSGKLRQLVIEGLFDKAERLVQRIKGFESEFQASTMRGNLFMTLGKFYLAREDIQNAVGNIKKALMDFQDCGGGTLEAEAYLLMSFVMLKEGKVDNAVDYLAIGSRLLPEDGCPYEKIQLHALAGVTEFIRGNLTKAMAETQKGKIAAHMSGRRIWELSLTFFMARIFFEFGRYSETLHALEECLALTTIYSMKEAQPVINSWLGRNFVYSGDKKTGLRLLLDLPPTAESRLFLAEAYYFYEEKKRALEILSAPAGAQTGWIPRSNETIVWDDGFIMAEGRCSRLSEHTSIFSTLSRAFRAYLVGINGNSKEGIEELYIITRMEKPSWPDPNMHLYYYLYSDLLQEHKNHEGYDSLTILNKALKQLQERASKIEDPYDRTRYLNNNYWNARIIETAKLKHLL